jgi:hypothetical protein
VPEPVRLVVRSTSRLGTNEILPHEGDERCGEMRPVVEEVQHGTAVEDAPFDRRTFEDASLGRVEWSNRAARRAWMVGGPDLALPESRTSATISSR